MDKEKIPPSRVPKEPTRERVRRRHRRLTVRQARTLQRRGIRLGGGATRIIEALTSNDSRRPECRSYVTPQNSRGRADQLAVGRRLRRVQSRPTRLAADESAGEHSSDGRVSTGVNS